MRDTGEPFYSPCGFATMRACPDLPSRRLARRSSLAWPSARPAKPTNSGARASSRCRAMPRQRASRSRTRGSRRPVRPTPGLFPVRSTGVSTAPVRRRRRAVPVDTEQGTARQDGVPARRPRVAEVDEPGLLRAPGRQLPRDDAGTARRRVRDAARVAQRQGVEADARHHAPQPHARRAERRRLRSLRRMALPHHRDGHAVSDRAVGLAVRRASRDRQLLRDGRSGRDDAVLRRLRAGHRHLRQVCRHVHSPGRTEPRPRDDPGARRAAAQEGDPQGVEDRQRKRRRSVEGQRRRSTTRACRRHSCPRRRRSS